MTEIEVKRIVKDVLRVELDKVNKKFDSMKNELTTLKKNSMDEESVRKLVRTMFINHYKWMWEKSSIYINKL
jgi:hypothetical protein